MDKFLQKTSSVHPSTKSQAKRPGAQQGQLRLSSCRKVVKLNASRYTICQSELASLREALENPASTAAELGHCLRHLDSLILHSDALIASKVGKAVKSLRKHPDTSVGAIDLRTSAADRLHPGLLHCWYVDHAVVELPEDHRFPKHKHRAIRRVLEEESQFKHLSQFHPSPVVSKHDLLRVHPEDYIDQFAAGKLSSKEMRTIGFPWNESMMKRQLHSSGGTLAACKALLAQPELRMTGHLAGGTHHAFADHGEGFCVFNDIAVAIKFAQAVHGLERILVIDLDVHQGNGTASIFQDDPRVVTFDMYCDRNYPWSSRMRATYDHAMPESTTDDEYLSVLKNRLNDVVDFSPQLIIFQAGVDALAEDSLGKMCLSRGALAVRNNLVYSFALGLSTPMLITLGGGYARPDATPSIEAHCDVFRAAAFRLGV